MTSELLLMQAVGRRVRIKAKVVTIATLPVTGWRIARSFYTETNHVLVTRVARYCEQLHTPGVGKIETGFNLTRYRCDVSHTTETTIRRPHNIRIIAKHLLLEHTEDNLATNQASICTTLLMTWRSNKTECHIHPIGDTSRGWGSRRPDYPFLELLWQKMSKAVAATPISLTWR